MGATGSVSSFNYEGGIHLANQDQKVCVRCDFFLREIKVQQIDHILQFAGVNLGSAPSVGAMQLAILILAMLLPPIWVTMQNRYSDFLNKQ